MNIDVYQTGRFSWVAENRFAGIWHVSFTRRGARRWAKRVIARHERRMQQYEARERIE